MDIVSFLRDQANTLKQLTLPITEVPLDLVDKYGFLHLISGYITKFGSIKKAATIDTLLSKYLPTLLISHPADLDDNGVEIHLNLKFEDHPVHNKIAVSHYEDDEEFPLTFDDVRLCVNNKFFYDHDCTDSKVKLSDPHNDYRSSRSLTI